MYKMAFEELQKSVLGTAEVKEDKGTIEISLTPKNKTYKDPCEGCKKRELLCSSFLCVKALKKFWGLK